MYNVQIILLYILYIYYIYLSSPCTSIQFCRHNSIKYIHAQNSNSLQRKNLIGIVRNTNKNHFNRTIENITRFKIGPTLYYSMCPVPVADLTQ